MKSAGKWSSNCVVPSCGAWYWANGIEPESNQTSMTSGTRCIGSLHAEQLKVTSSTNGRCGSSNCTPDTSRSSSNEPITWSCSHDADEHRQTGSGVPQ